MSSHWGSPADNIAGKKAQQKISRAQIIKLIKEGDRNNKTIARALNLNQYNPMIIQILEDLAGQGWFKLESGQDRNYNIAEIAANFEQECN